MSDGGGPTMPMVNDPGHSAIGGRGLSIVQRLALRWGACSSSYEEGGTTVWAELQLHCIDADASGDLTATEDATEVVSRGTWPVPVW